MFCKQLLFVIDALSVGGAEKSLLSLLSQLVTQKYGVFLWILHRGGELEAFLPEGVVILSLPSYSVLETVAYRGAQILYSLYFRFLQLFGVKRHLAETLWRCTGWATNALKKEFDVAIAYQQGTPTFLLANKISAKKKIAWINTDMIRAGYDMNYNKQFYAMCDKIVSVSRELQNLIQSIYPEFNSKLYCIYDILSPVLIRQQASFTPAEIRTIDGVVLIATVGRLVSPKNYPLAIETARLLRDRQIQYKWLIIGEGSERSHIEQLIEKYGLEQQVILLGVKTNPYPYIDQCDIYVQTSSFEGFGLTIAEAKILGKPVVSTNFDVVHDQLLHEHNGLIADMTAESVADNIIRLIRDDTLRQKIIENVKTETNTTAETEIKKVEKLLDED